MSHQESSNLVPALSAGTETPAAGAVLYTAGQVALALGCSRRAVLYLLDDVPAPGVVQVRGQAAKGWDFNTLPGSLQMRLEAAAERNHFRNAEQLLARSGAERAAVAALGNATGAADYRGCHGPLADVLRAHLPERKTLSRADLDWVWPEICEHYVLISSGANGKERTKLKRSLVQFLLLEVPGLVRPEAAKPAHGLTRVLNRKLVVYRKEGRLALRDKRTENSGRYRPVLCGGCWELVLTEAGRYGKNESRAWRELKTSGRLCPDCRDRHKLDVRRDKCAVPRSVRNVVTPLVEWGMPWLKSDSAGIMAGPSAARDWSDTEPGDFFVGDDVTFNHEVYDYDERGKLHIFRPECLFFCDERTSYPVGFILINGHYNGRHIRLGMLKVHDRFGLPRKGFKFERGVWNSRLVNDKLGYGEDLPFRDTESGFRNLNMLFEMRHARARNPRTKVVEGDFGILQNMMRGLPGYVGFNEREERTEAITKAKRRALAGDREQLKYFHSFAEWERRLADVFHKFATEPQNGGRNPGKTPEESWFAGTNRSPLRKLSASERGILATTRQVKKVTSSGFELSIGKSQPRLPFFGGELLRFVGQVVLVLYHVDAPGVVTVCDRKRRDWVTLEANVLPANTATREQLETLERNRAEFNRGGRVIGGMIKGAVVSTVERESGSELEREEGRKMEAAKAALVDGRQRKMDGREQLRREGERLLRLGAMQQAAAEAESASDQA